MILSLRMTVDLRDNTCKIFSSVGLNNFDLSINRYRSVCNCVITFVLWTYTCRPMFLWMIIYTLD